MFVFAHHRNEVGRFFIKDVFGRFCTPSTRGAVQSVDRTSVVGSDDSTSLFDSLCGERMLRSSAEVHLARIRIADVVAFPFVLTKVPNNVGTGCNGLRFQRLELSKRRRAKLIWYNTEEVLLQRQLIHDR